MNLDALEFYVHPAYLRAILIGAMISLALLVRMPSQALTFEERWAPVKEIPQPRELTFEERWQPVRSMPPSLEMPPLSKPVKTISFPVPTEPTPEQPATVVPRPPPLPPIRDAVPIIRASTRNVCERHNMRKEPYVKHGWAYWRCRR